jgi:hypothetical protein
MARRPGWWGWWPLLLIGPALAAPEGTVLQLAFDGDLHDAGGHGHDAFAANPRFAAGRGHQALQVGGEAASVSDAADLRLAPGLRLEGWVKFTGTPPAGQSVVTKEREYMLRVDPAEEGAQFAFFVYLDGCEPRVRSTVVPRTDAWYHWIAGWDGAQLSLDVNGTVTHEARAGQPVASGEALVFGPLEGLLQDVSLINPAARQTGVAHWAFDGDLRDDTGHGHDIAAPGARFGAGLSGQAVRLDAPLTVPDSADLRLAPGLRLDATVRFDQLPPTYGYVAIKDDAYQLRVDSPQEGGRFSFFVDLGGWEPRVQSPVKAEVGVWYHLSARWDGQTLSLDVNGRHTQVVRSGLARPSDKPLILGPIPGWLDDLRIENPRLPVLRVRALTQEQTLLRSGRPERLTAVIENLGSPATDAVAALELEPGVNCLSEARLALGDLPTGAAKTVTWTVQAAGPMSNTATVRLVAGAHKPPPYRRALAFFGATDSPTPPPLVDPAVTPPGGAPATVYYVDSAAGDNAHAGTSPGAAWRDFTNINGKTLGAGERLLIKRGSVIDQELQISARGTARRWAEIGTYGDGPRPILRRNWDISERCVWVQNPDYLLIRGLVVCYAGKGLIVQYRGGDHRGLVIEDCIAHHIEGLYRPNAHGIPEWRDRSGAPGDGLESSAGIAVVGWMPRDVLMRDCEMFACSWGFFMVGDNVTVDRVFCHDNYVENTSPHPAMISVHRSFLQNSLFDAPGGHASAGTMGIMLVDPEGLVIRNCTFRNQPDSGSADEGGIDFENSGNGCLIDRCTFQNNPGAAIEVLGLETPQPRNLEIADSRFIQNNTKLKLGPAEIYIFGQSPSADVCCSTGSIHGNGYVTLPGVQFLVNEAPKTTSWTVRDNTAYGSPAELRRAMPLPDPPVADAGPAVYSDHRDVRLAGRATGGKPPAVHWEVLEGPGPVTFQPADAAATTADVPVPGDYLLRLVADDGVLWHSSRVAVHRLPAGATTAVAWEFNHQRDKEGWSEANLGTHPQEWANQPWPTHSEPVKYVSGGYWVLAIENSSNACLLSPDSLGTDLAAVKTLRLRLMNRTPATHMRLCFTTAAEPTWDLRRSVLFEVTANDPAPRVCTVDLTGLPGWSGRLKQLRLDLATGAPVTGTCRLDYVWLGAAPAGTSW